MSRLSRTDRPTFELESECRSNGFQNIAGVDEAGRGPWAGPVVAAAVILVPDKCPNGLQDSKKLSANSRETLFEKIKETADVGVGLADPREIDEHNILQATFLAMQRAIANLEASPDMALVDGKLLPQLPCAGQAIVKGDGRSLSVAAASIIAKVTRDRIMTDLALEFPDYGWERNKGYGTKDHQNGLASAGVTQHHRRSFKPIHKILCLDES